VVCKQENCTREYLPRTTVSTLIHRGLLLI
jgi:hypothetical protein